MADGRLYHRRALVCMSQYVMLDDDILAVT